MVWPSGPVQSLDFLSCTLAAPLEVTSAVLLPAALAPFFVPFQAFDAPFFVPRQASPAVCSTLFCAKAGAERPSRAIKAIPKIFFMVFAFAVYEFVQRYRAKIVPAVGGTIRDGKPFVAHFIFSPD